MSVCWFVLLPVSLYVSTSLENDWIFFSKTLHIWTFEILLKWSESLKILTPVGFFVPIFVGFFLSHFLLLWWSLHKKKSKHGPLCWESFWGILRLICFSIFFDNHSIFLLLGITVMVIPCKTFFHAIYTSAGAHYSGIYSLSLGQF